MYVQAFLRKCPPFHVTDDDVEPSIDVEYLEVDTIVAHQFVRGRGGKVAVLYETRWICNVSAVPFFSIGQENQFNVAMPAINVTATCDGAPLPEKFIKNEANALLPEDTCLLVANSMSVFLQMVVNFGVHT